MICVPVGRRLGFAPLHYGVYDGYGGVFHFNGITPADAQIHYSLFADFAKGGTVSVDSCIKIFSPQEIVERAISKVGEDFGGFNLLTNNCEHFARWCATDVRQSSQVIAAQSFIEKISDHFANLIDRAKATVLNRKKKWMYR